MKNETKFYSDNKKNCAIAIGQYVRWLATNPEHKWVDEIPYFTTLAIQFDDNLKQITPEHFRSRTGKDPQEEASRLTEAIKKLKIVDSRETPVVGDDRVDEEVLSVHTYPWVGDAIPYTAEEIKIGVASLGRRITTEYADKPSLTLVCILKSAFVFTADLIRHIEHPALDVEFLDISRSDNDKVMNRTVASLKGKHVIVIDDVSFTGRTLTRALQLVESHKPASVRTALAIIRPREIENPQLNGHAQDGGEDWFVVIWRNGTPLRIHYFPFLIESVGPYFGYGMDIDGRDRGLPFIAEEEEEEEEVV